MHFVALATGGQVAFFKFDAAAQAETKVRKTLGLLKISGAEVRSIMRDFFKIRVVAQQTGEVPVYCLLVEDNGVLLPFAYATKDVNTAQVDFQRCAQHAHDAQSGHSKLSII